MPSYDFHSPRLFVSAPLAPGAIVPLETAQAHYLTHVLRLKAGAPVLVFNGQHGEWHAALTPQRRGAAVHLGNQTRPQTAAGPDLHYLFVPLKAARLAYMG